MKLTKLMLTWLIIGYCAMILFLSVTSIKSAGALNKSKVIGFRSDYLLHVLLLVPWMILARWRWGKESNGKDWFWIALSVGLGIAGISELVQWPLPYRTFNIFDFMANCLGVVIGALISGWGWRARSARQ